MLSAGMEMVHISPIPALLTPRTLKSIDYIKAVHYAITVEDS